MTDQSARMCRLGLYITETHGALLTKDIWHLIFNSCKNFFWYWPEYYSNSDLHLTCKQLDLKIIASSFDSKQTSCSYQSVKIFAHGRDTSRANLKKEKIQQDTRCSGQQRRIFIAHAHPFQKDFQLLVQWYLISKGLL